VSSCIVPVPLPVILKITELDQVEKQNKTPFLLFLKPPEFSIREMESTKFVQQRKSPLLVSSVSFCITEITLAHDPAGDALLLSLSSWKDVTSLCR
jgi:hypothetical protein